MKLILDSAAENFDGFEFLKEDVNGSDKPTLYKLRGIYALSSVKNGNGRLYPHEVLKEAIEEFDKEMILTNRALGELEHPTYPEIKPDQAAIRILSLKEDKNCWIGESCILASQPKFGIVGTPKGDILLGLVQYGTKMGFSTRCLGDVDDDGTVTDLKMCTIDCVQNPSIGQFCESNGNRFVNGILESKEFIINTHGEILEKPYRKFEKKLAKLPRTFIQSKKDEYVAEAVEAFLGELC